MSFVVFPVQLTALSPVFSPSEIKNLDTETLIDLLAFYTDTYTNTASSNTTKEQLDNYKAIIALIQSEIQLRKKT